MKSESRHAMVLSGGAANGAYEIGVMKALFSGASPVTEHSMLDAEVFCGTSVGAFNAAFLVSHWQQGCCSAIESLERVWLDEIAAAPGTCGNAVMRFRFNPAEFLDPFCLMREPLRFLNNLAEDTSSSVRSFSRRTAEFLQSRETLDRRVLELFDMSLLIACESFPKLLRRVIDYERVRSSSADLRIAVTDWENGKLLTFDNQAMDDRWCVDVIAASCAIPGIFPPVEIDGVPCVDGGCLMNTPLKSAIRAHADIIHVIYLDVDLSQIEMEPITSTFETVNRLTGLLFSANVNNEIKGASLVNQGLEVLERLSRGGSSSLQEATNFIRVAKKVADRLEDGDSYKPLTIHRYRPSHYLGGLLGMLNFERDRLEDLIALGYQETLEHDCRISGCILPNQT